MKKRSTRILLQLILTINIATAQLHYSIDYSVPQSARSLQSHVPNLNSTHPTIHKRDTYEHYLASIISRGFIQLVLDVNRITQAISLDVANADYAIYGPITISGALAIVMLASVGRTFDEAVNVLGLSSVPGIQNNPIYAQQQLGRLFEKLETTTGVDVGQHVTFACGIFVQEKFPIRPEYRDLLQNYYKSNVINLDFLGNPKNAKKVINDWVSTGTNGKIPTLLDKAPPPETTAIIATVFYFQALWQFPFLNGQTTLRPFYTNGRKNPSTKMVEMMGNGGKFPYYRNPSLGVEIMGFPYKGGHTTMYVVLPFGSNKEKLRQLENSLTPEHIHDLVNNTKYTEAVILFPKMRLESSINLKSTLQMMGVNALFDPDQANLGLLSPGPSPSLYSKNNQDFKVMEQASCVPVYNPITKMSKCRVQLSTILHNIRNKGALPHHHTRQTNSNYDPIEELEKVRQQIIQSPLDTNPGVFADQVIEKVYIDITESGTEAAAATGIGLDRSGGKVAFRVDVPFLFFIYHEDSQLILFWGSVKTPAPSVSN